MMKRSVLTALLLLFYACPSFGEQMVIREVIDGDTLFISSKERVRLIGIDSTEYHEDNKMALESQNWNMEPKKIRQLGLASKEFLEKLISYGKGKVLILYDRQNVYSGHKDKYGRKLGYVYVKMSGSTPDDDSFVFQEIGGSTYLFVNATMVKAGYAFAYLRFPFQHSERFSAYEEYSRENKKGLWAAEDGYPVIWKYIKRMRELSVKEIDIISAVTDDPDEYGEIMESPPEFRHILRAGVSTGPRASDRRSVRVRASAAATTI